MCLGLGLHCIVHECRAVCEGLKPCTVVKITYFVTLFGGGKSVSCPCAVWSSNGNENEEDRLVWFLYDFLVVNSLFNDHHSKNKKSVPDKKKAPNLHWNFHYLCLFSFAVNHSEDSSRTDFSYTRLTWMFAKHYQTLRSKRPEARAWRQDSSMLPSNTIATPLSQTFYSDDILTGQRDRRVNFGSLQHDLKWLIRKISRKYARRFLVNVGHAAAKKK